VPPRVTFAELISCSSQQYQRGVGIADNTRAIEELIEKMVN
jgi:hypothetical protein